MWAVSARGNVKRPVRGELCVQSWGLSSVEKDDSRDQLDRCEKISGEFVIAGRDGSKVLNFIEEALDEVALAVKVRNRNRVWSFDRIWGNYRRGSRGGKRRRTRSMPIRKP
jgi:3-deoxy-D-arabino-heptulosonate 7-phosphate (DAHP) synthase class II